MTAGLRVKLVAWGVIASMFSLVISCANATAGMATSQKWEVAVIFLGANEDAAYQADIDENLRELAMLPARPGVKLSIYRDFPTRDVFFQPDAESMSSLIWDPLFMTTPIAGVEVGGRMESWKSPGDPSLARDLDRFAKVLEQSFGDPEARRLLVIWGHGLGHEGLQEIRLPALRTLLESAIPPRVAGEKSLDFLWFDSCFMASIEAAYEFSGVARFLLAPELAEFSSGIPFEALQNSFQSDASLEEIAIDLARAAVESYSYLRRGSQRANAQVSPFSISVVDLAILDDLVDELAVFVRDTGRISAEARSKLMETYSLRATGLPEQGDLVGFLSELRKTYAVEDSAHARLGELLFRLEGLRRGRMRTDERIRIRMPPGRERVWLVYGYHNWIYGSLGDEFTQSKLAPEMKANGFVLGRFGLEWPYLELRGSRDITPFGVDRNQFHYYFIDPETGAVIGEERSRLRDIDREAYDFLARNPENPLRFHSYTQGAGGFAERFMGLAVFDRSHPVSSRFLRTRFAEKTGWGNF